MSLAVLALTLAQGVTWESLPELPDPVGYGGAYVFTLERDGEEVLVVAGGANFPEAPPWDGGEKRWHADTWIFDGESWTAGTPLPAPSAYGAALSVDGEAWLVGGGDEGATSSAVWRARFDENGELRFEAGPSLPADAEHVCAGVVDGRIVVVGGTSRPDPERSLEVDEDPGVVAREPVPDHLRPPRAGDTFVLDLAGGGSWRRGARHPGRTNHKMVAVALDDAAGRPSLFVVSGEVSSASNTRGKDLWSYELKSDEWTRRASLPEAPRSAGTAVALGPSHFAVFSGVGGVDDRVPLAERPEFRRTYDVYHTITDTWFESTGPPMARGVVTTGLTKWRDGFVIASGEVRPGVRTTEVQFGRVEREPARLASLDYGVIALYLGALLVLGWWFSRRAQNAEDFFVAGHRIPWWAAGLSIYATQLSAITYVSIPAKAFVDDHVFALTSLTILVMAPIVVAFYLPFYRRLDLSTAYEYLERRFSLPVRLFGSASFMAFQVARMAIVVFLPSLALSTVTGLDVYACIATIGLFATAYTVLGGFEAVVWTDVVQVFVLIGGLFVALFLAVDGAGGFAAAHEIASEAGKLRMFAPGTSWTETASWSVLLGAMFLQFGPYTTDQAVVQRYLSTKDERSAARGIWLNGLIAVPFTFAFFWLGSALFAYFSAKPEALAIGMQNDEVLPLFLALEMPAGLAGLVFAGIFSASMSSLDSSMHAIATAWTNDWHQRLGLGRADALTVGRRVTFLMGIVGTGAAAAMAALELRSLYDAFQSVLGLLISPLAGLFILGIFTKRTSAVAACFGAAVSIATLAWVQRTTPLNFMLYGAVGTSTCVVAALLASVAMPERRNVDGLTWSTRSRV